MSSKIRNGKCTGQNLPFSPKATINKKIWQQFHSSSSGSSHKQLPRSKIQQDLQSNWLLEHAELLHTTALVLEWTGLNLGTRVTLGNKARDVGRSAQHGRGGGTWCSAGKRLSSCEASACSLCTTRRVPYVDLTSTMNWCLVARTGLLSVHALHLKKLPWLCLDAGALPGASMPVVSCLPSCLLSIPAEAQTGHPPKAHSARSLDEGDSKHRLC